MATGQSKEKGRIRRLELLCLRPCTSGMSSTSSNSGRRQAVDLLICYVFTPNALIKKKNLWRWLLPVGSGRRSASLCAHAQDREAAPCARAARGCLWRGCCRAFEMLRGREETAGPRGLLDTHVHKMKRWCATGIGSVQPRWLPRMGGRGRLFCRPHRWKRWNPGTLGALGRGQGLEQMNTPTPSSPDLFMESA